MKDMVKIVLSGIGGYGNTYVNALLDSRDERFVLAGMADPFPNSCRRLAEALGKFKDARLWGSLEEFYAAGNEADLCVVASPIQFHTPQILCALSHGSNVLCEKPLTGDERDIEKLIRARETAGKFVSVGYQWSHSAAVLGLKSDITGGMYGAPVSLKTITLWPRDKAYFGRGTGWAGKLAASDGTPIRDSVANNAAAHYLHNIFFILGPTLAESREPERVKARLRRANPIETFDTAEIELDFGGFRALYVASHATRETRDPEFYYEFEKGYAVYPEIKDSKKQIAGHFAGGEVKYYGDPFACDAEKLWRAAKACLSGVPDVVCGIETAAVQVRCIAEAHKSPVTDFEPGRVKLNVTADGREFTYVEGLGEELGGIYANFR